MFIVVICHLEWAPCSSFVPNPDYFGVNRYSLKSLQSATEGLIWSP